MKQKEFWELLSRIQMNSPKTTALILEQANDSQLEAMTAALQNNAHINTIFFEGCSFTDQNITHFMHVLRDKEIEMFCANGLNNLTDQGALEIFINLALCPAIRHVSVSAKNITDKTATGLALLAGKPGQLLSFAIHGDYITGKGAAYLGRAALENPSLKHLLISVGDLTGETDLKPLSHAMIKNASLEGVEVRCQKISRQNIHHLIRGLEGSENLSWMHMGAEQAERMSVDALLTVLDKNKERIGFDIERGGRVVVRTDISDQQEFGNETKETAQVIELGLNRQIPGD